MSFNPFIFYENGFSNTMKLITKWKRGITVFSLFLILIVGTSNPVLSYNLVFEEDFSDSELPGWNLLGLDWCGDEKYEEVQAKLIYSSYVVQNGQLESLGNNDCAQFNYAIHTNPIKYGNWSFDYKHVPMKSFWQVLFIDDYKQWNKTESERNDTWVGIHDRDSVRVEHGSGLSSPNYEEGKYFQTNSSSYPYLNKEWFHIEIVRNLNGYLVYIDQYLMLNQTTPPEYDYEYEYVILLSEFESTAAYDNFTISEQGPPPETSTKGDTNWAVILFGGTFGMIIVFYSWSKGKKNF